MISASNEPSGCASIYLANAARVNTPAACSGGVDFRRKHITLNEWFEEWFQIYKLPVVKETSVYPMKNKFYGSFGRYLGERKLCDITNIDIQSVINQMSREGRAVSSMREALGRMRECMESARNNQILSINPCFEISVPWENKQVTRRFLSREEQNMFLKMVEHNWWKKLGNLGGRWNWRKRKVKNLRKNGLSGWDRHLGKDMEAVLLLGSELHILKEIKVRNKL